VGAVKGGRGGGVVGGGEVAGGGVGGVGVGGGALLEELIERTRLAPHPERTELAARQARAWSSWRLERAKGGIIGLRVRGAINLLLAPASVRFHRRLTRKV
jgi:hypothetical protein